MVLLTSRYMKLVVIAMIESEKSTNLETRIANFNDFFTYLLYSNICRSLFEKDKMLLSFLICTTLLQQRSELDAEQVRLLAAGSLSIDRREFENPAAWLPPKLWAEMLHASEMPSFSVTCLRLYTCC